MKHYKSNLLSSIILLSVLLFSCSKEPSAELKYFEKEDVQAAINAVDQRSSEALLPFLKHPDQDVRWAAAHGAISMNDSSLIAPLANALLDSIPEIRRECYLALGATGNVRASEIIFEILPKEKDKDCRKAAWYALGKTCNAADFQNVFLAAQEENAQNDPSWFLYWTGVRGIGGGSSIKLALKWLNEAPVENRLGAAHFLSRTPNLSLDQYDEALMKAYKKEENMEVKIALALAFRNDNMLSKETALSLIVDAQDERLVQNLFRAAWTKGLFSAADVLPWLGEQHHPLSRKLVAQWMVDQPWDRSLFDLMSAQLKTYDEEMQSIIIKGILANSQNKAPWLDDVRQRFSLNGTPPHIKANYVRALIHDDHAIPFLSTLLDETQDKVVSTSAIETLVEMKASDRWDPAIDFESIIDMVLELKDIAQVYTIANHLSDPNMNYKLTYKGVDKLELLARELELPRAMEAYIALQQAIAYLNGSEYETPKPSYNHPINFEVLKDFDKRKAVLVNTSRGSFKLKLNPKGAPGSVANFLLELEAGTYDGRTFHRVVPNFVVQGACPRGDGFGGPNYSLRTEAGAQTYRTGTIGLASAGKDTEGIQWFITHSPTPHLEGNYSAFGTVSEGMDVVRSIQVGDQIISVELVNSENE